MSTIQRVVPALGRFSQSKTPSRGAKCDNRAMFALVLLLAADFRFVLIGDRTGTETPGVYAQVWREAAAAKPAFAIAIGDMIQGDSAATAAAEWREAFSLMGPALKKYYVQGNHDRDFKLHIPQPALFSFDFQGAHFVLLGDSPNDLFSEEQAAFLKADLEKHQSAPLKFVLLHRPVWFTGLHAIAQKYGVHTVFSGHVHRYARLKRDDVQYVLVGSSGGSLRGHHPADHFADGWFYSHIVADVAGREVKLEVKETAAPFGKARRFLVGQEAAAGLK